MRFLRTERVSGARALHVQLSNRWSLSINSSTLILLILSASYILSFQHFRSASFRDPTSYFFDPGRAYQKLYSAKRIVEAEAFLKEARDVVPIDRVKSEVPLVCVGIATVNRRGEQYVKYTISSLLAGLEPEQRRSLFLNVLLAHSDSRKHLDYSEDWMNAYPDRVSGYEVDDKDLDMIRAWEEGGWYRNKTIYDYTYLMKDCYETGARYILMVEDDVLAAAGWWPRTIESISTVESKMNSRIENKWVYLRLFYADDLLGWNSEEWVQYLGLSFSLWAALTELLILLRRRSKCTSAYLSDKMLVIISGCFIPAVVALYFMAGRQTVLPLGRGVHEMNKYGCCSQALLYPREIVPLVLEHADLSTDWLVDMMMEQLADREDWARWAVIPAVMQHIGATSSKGYGFDSNARRLWNFRFEEQNL